MKLKVYIIPILSQRIHHQAKIATKFWQSCKIPIKEVRQLYCILGTILIDLRGVVQSQGARRKYSDSFSLQGIDNMQLIPPYPNKRQVPHLFIIMWKCSLLRV